MLRSSVQTESSNKAVRRLDLVLGFLSKQTLRAEQPACTRFLDLLASWIQAAAAAFPELAFLPVNAEKGPISGMLFQMPPWIQHRRVKV